ncbi:hypothetical protein Forpi1262_v017200 [Fusarium oxysporum f. sp. raphani]|uniref:BZIP domain-containing protein n=1 Tax=Fusarium oxysporum f. sp. raphani TaxID=96318 RepID=A0A8J5NU02_FUSOX|nr:hypothetical protein Forpi1262_v017200 [Fusarium oxysporum f. sp. raphani]
MSTTSTTSRSSSESAATELTGASPNSPQTPPTPTWPSRDFTPSKPAASQDNKLPPLGRLGKGQCDGRDEACTGGLVSMSHTGSASQHASRRSSRSPLRDDQVSPSSARHRQLGDRDLRQDVSNVPYTNGEERLQQVPHKTLGVHNILNPMEPRILSSGGNGHLPPAARPSESATPGQTVGPISGSIAGTRAFLPAQPASISLPGWPAVPESRTPKRVRLAVVKNTAKTWDGGSLFGVEGQQALLALPGSEAPIPVHMDFSQASKKADEKRQRNAVASTRHRRKKKIMQEENSKQLQELRDERRLMEIRIAELIQQRDFYREDRNRLRDIVAQTPSIGGLAAGPPSPTISTSNSYAETGSLASGPSGSMSYGDVLANERPAQRRRTDDHPEYSLPPYGSPASGHPSASPSGLPPMPMSGYGGPSRPSSAASSASGERLPPLRVMEGRPPTGPPPGPGVQEQDPRTGQWVPVQPRVPETGWATRDTHRRA